MTVDAHFKAEAAALVAKHREETGTAPLPCDVEAEKKANGRAKPDPIADLKAGLEDSRLDLADLATKSAPPREFVFDPWMPAGTTTLLHGFGGSGKSLLLQQMVTAYALNVGLFGGASPNPNRRPALLLAGEDDADELWRRQEAICRRLGFSLRDLAEKLTLLAVPHIDITIASGGDNAVLTTTPFWAALSKLIRDGKFGLSALDNASMLYAIPEGNRGAVTRSVGLLNGLCKNAGTSVLLAAHDNKNGEFSGSTAWENSCRARMHLTRDSENVTKLKLPKANYSDRGEVVLVWDDWSFRADDPAFMTPSERLDAELAEREHAMVFLRALDRLTEQGCNISDSKKAGNYAARVILESDLGEGLSQTQLAKALRLLLNEGRVLANQPVGRADNRHQRYGLARA